MKKFLFLSILMVLGLIAISSTKLDEPNSNAYLVITTEYGEIKALLYDETPLHRDNIIKNVRAGVYDSLLFHRVIKSFMIQGGDPDSKNAKAGDVLGNGGLDYKLSAEIKTNLFHKRGALCAARESDQVNPKKESSSTQFYIVQGQVFTDEMLTKTEARVNQMTQNAIYWELLNKTENQGVLEKYNKAYAAQDEAMAMEALATLKPEVMKVVEERGGVFKYTEEQRKIYKSIGGAAHLDGNYTVFGEVVSGMDVVDKIAEEIVDGNHRPLKDIRMSIKIVYE